MVILLTPDAGSLPRTSSQQRYSLPLSDAQVYQVLYTQLGVVPSLGHLVALHIVDANPAIAAMSPANLALVTSTASALQELSFPCRPASRYLPDMMRHNPCFGQRS
jgi:hypothetical protein